MNNYDMINVKRFQSGDINKLLCTMCGQYTTLEDSISHRGWNLICLRCEGKMRAILGEHYGFIDKIHQVGKLHEDEAINNGEYWRDTL